MRIALTFNEKRSTSEHDAEFDTPETIAAISGLLVGLGHDVTAVEVTCPVEQILAQLRQVAPQLVFNLAEGTHGRFREALVPALCEHEGFAHTGSAASVLALCLDKMLAKRVVAAAGVSTPRAQLVRDVRELGPIMGRVIVKPNFEGSSKGITQASVVERPAQLVRVVEQLLARYPSGVLVEDFVDGNDVAVGWVEPLGVLPSIGYAYEPTGRHHIYDYALKQGPPERIHVEVPAPLPAAAAAMLAHSARRAFAALGVTGYGRADFRVTPAGEVWFLELNPLPSLAPGERDLYLAAAAMATSPRELIAHIVAQPLAQWAA